MVKRRIGEKVREYDVLTRDMEPGSALLRSTEIPAVAAGNCNCTAPTLLAAARHRDRTLRRDPAGSTTMGERWMERDEWRVG
ncbi:hypothetical protein L195_g056656 [Trifolium pratense]|uniref:Uncharacterized protein n=1 Tax=Trifolium pratense TaxID=57577 RepID=A0A2K3KSR9_TRIPR|nr:hypothetical protein L195_g056656 [Trifolium pratense]